MMQPAKLRQTNTAPSPRMRLSLNVLSIFLTRNILPRKIFVNTGAWRQIAAVPGPIGAWTFERYQELAARHVNSRVLDCTEAWRRGHRCRDWRGQEGMRKKSVSRGAETATKQAPKPDSILYDDDTIEAAWLEQRPDLDMAMACTLLRLERVNRLHEKRLQEISTNRRSADRRTLRPARASALGKAVRIAPDRPVPRPARHFRRHDQARGAAAGSRASSSASPRMTMAAPSWSA